MIISWLRFGFRSHLRNRLLTLRILNFLNFVIYCLLSFSCLSIWKLSQFVIIRYSHLHTGGGPLLLTHRFNLEYARILKIDIPARLNGRSYNKRLLRSSIRCSCFFPLRYGYWFWDHWLFHQFELGKSIFHRLSSIQLRLWPRCKNLLDWYIRWSIRDHPRGLRLHHGDVWTF